MAKIKDLVKEFKDFALSCNVVDMAVGVVIGGAFGKVVTALVDLVITPILDALPKVSETGGTGFAGAFVSLLGVIVNFVLTALVLFAIIKAMNAASKAVKKPEAPKAPTTKKCPFCCTEIAIEATRCPNCTSELKDDPSKK